MYIFSLGKTLEEVFSGSPSLQKMSDVMNELPEAMYTLIYTDNRDPMRVSYMYTLIYTDNIDPIRVTYMYTLIYTDNRDPMRVTYMYTLIYTDNRDPMRLNIYFVVNKQCAMLGRSLIIG